jgi:phosphoribosylaminoimidazole-succinocarboxamide synthase
MQQTQHLAANALLDVPDPNVSIMQRCTVFPVEFVVRGFLTGDSTAPLQVLFLVYLSLLHAFSRNHEVPILDCMP